MGHYDTFIVRIWSDKEGRMHGTIEHIASHEGLAFMELEAIIPFIGDHLQSPIDNVENEECGYAEDEGTD